MRLGKRAFMSIQPMFSWFPTIYYVEPLWMQNPLSKKVRFFYALSKVASTEIILKFYQQLEIEKIFV